MPEVLERLAAAGLLEESDGAEVVFPPGFTNREGEPLPLIVRSRAGAFTYATSDLACVLDRVERVGADAPAVRRRRRRRRSTSRWCSPWPRWPAGCVRRPRPSTSSFGNVLGDGPQDAQEPQRRAGHASSTSSTRRSSAGSAAVAEKNPELPPSSAHAVGHAGRHRRAEVRRPVDRPRSATTSSTGTGCCRSTATRRRTCSTPTPGSARSSAGPASSGRRVRGDGAGARRAAGAGAGAARARASARPSPRRSSATQPAPAVHVPVRAGVGLHGVLRALPGAQGRRRSTPARLALSDVTARVLERGLDLLGIEAPQRDVTGSGHRSGHGRRRATAIRPGVTGRPRAATRPDGRGPVGGAGADGSRARRILGGRGGRVMIPDAGVLIPVSFDVRSEPRAVSARRCRRRCCRTRRRSAPTGRCRSAAATSPSSPPSTARRCSSTTRRTCAPAAARRSPRSGPAACVYATKAFLCRAMARLAHEEGMLLDVASGGELHVALAAGVPAGACTLHGNNKSLDELRMALDAGVRHDRRRQLRRARPPRRAARRRRCPCRDVLLRITPGVHAHTHEYIATGQDDSKFGFNLANGDAAAAVERAPRSPSVELVGLHCHIGSNVFAAESFARAAEVMAAFAAPLDLPELVLGGGLGVAYVEGEEAPTITEWAERVLDACRGLGVTVGGQRRARPGDRRRRGGHRLHGRHDQGHPGRAHVRRRRRRDERQPPPRAVRQRLRGVPAAGRRRRAARRGPRRRQALRVRRRAAVRRRACRPTSRSATCWPCRSPAPTATRWDPTTTRCRARRSCSSPTARPASSCAARPTTTCCATDVG